jgi:membrane associated rhomboid family serine protease
MNVAGLWCLGMIAEPVIGSRRFAIAYLASGVVCGISIALLIPSSPKPVGGASGAICGVLGGFLALRWSVPHRWRMPFVLVETAAALGLAVWLVLRTPHAAPDRLCALMWHLIPFLAGWLWVRWGRGRLRGH